MRKEMTPEERLLTLIKNKKKAPDAAPRADEPAVKKSDARFDDVLKSELFKNKLFDPATLKKTNRYLVIALGIIAFYLLIEIIFIRPYKNVEKIIEKGAVEEKAAAASSPKNAVMVKDYTSYSGAISNKNVFGPSSGAALGADNIAVSGDISERLGLVGVVTGDNPQAIIEDKKSQKTYYLNKGQSFDGYIVEEISEGKVVLDSGGNKISLFL